MTRLDGPGKLIEIGGRNLYLHASGEGPFTVILECGSTIPAVLWEPVQQAVSQFARVVSYDRAGYGWSDPSGRDRSGERIVGDLHTLLERAGIPGPYIFVAHSLGGLYARLFAARYPSEVVGMVLIDALQEDLRRRYPPSYHRQNWWGRRLLVLLCALGILRRAVRRNPRMLTGRQQQNWLDQFPPERHQPLFAALYTPKLALAALREWMQLDGVEEAVRQAGSLGDLPLIVLSQTRPDLDGWGYSEETKAMIRQILQDAQAALVGISARAKHLPVPDAGHLIYLEHPEVVVEAIRELVGILTATPAPVR